MKSLFITLLCFMMGACATGGTFHSGDINDYDTVTLAGSVNHQAEITKMLSGLGFTVLDPGVIPAGSLIVRMQTLRTGKTTRVRLLFIDPAAEQVVFNSEGVNSEQATGDTALAEAIAKAGEGLYGAYIGPVANPRSLPEPVQIQDKSGSHAEVAADIRDEAPAPLERVSRTRGQLVRYYDKFESRLDNIEGIWTDATDSQTVAFFVDTVPARRDFVGIVLSDSSNAYGPGDVCFEVKSAAEPGRYVATRYGSDGAKTGGILAITGKHDLTFTAGDTGAAESAVEYLRNYPGERSASGEPAGPLSFGTGFLVSMKGYLVTNYHVVDDAKTISAVFPALGKKFKAKIFAKDERNDLALIKLEGAQADMAGIGPIPYRLSNISSPREGQDIFTMGFPLGDDTGPTHKVTTGVISSLTGMRGDPGRMQITSPIQPGSSGGPLFDRKGRLVGIVVASVNEQKYYERQGFMPQNMNFAVKGCHLDALLDLLPERALDDAAESAERTLEDLVQDFKPFVAMLEIRGECPVPKTAVAMEEETSD